jgi:ornithine cyclodeaminase/alanine dehydrogenase-like protein (mu-crystallin family)
LPPSEASCYHREEPFTETDRSCRDLRELRLGRAHGIWLAFCPAWEQASHNGDLAHAVEAGLIERDDVNQLGDVLAGAAEGRRSQDEITVFDSTGLAIQDLAIALAALERADELDLPQLDL